MPQFEQGIESEEIPSHNANGLGLRRGLSDVEWCNVRALMRGLSAYRAPRPGKNFPNEQPMER